MDKKQSDSQGLNRSRYVSTPEIRKKNVPATSFTNVPTTSRFKNVRSMSETIQPHNLFHKRKPIASRQSILPSQILLDTAKEEEAKSKDMELKLIYNDYLQTMMLEHLAEKKSEKMKDTIVRQLANIAKECAGDEEKLHKLKTREREIMHLSIVQTELDAQMLEINEYIKSGKIDTLKDIMSHLCSVLEPLDRLRCNDIILPEKSEDWLALHEALKECGNTLGNIRKLIDTNAKTYQAVYDGIKDFTTTYNDIESLKEKLDEELCHLQVITLKYASFSLEQYR